MIRKALTSLLAVAATSITANAATLIGPVELARWDASDGTLNSSATAYPYLDVAPANLVGGGGVAVGAGNGGGDALVLNGPNPGLPDSYAAFAITNTHPTESFALDEVRLAFRITGTTSEGFALFYHEGSAPPPALDSFGDFEDEIPISSDWSGYVAPLFFLNLAPGETLTIAPALNDSNPTAFFLDDVVITGMTVIPEPSTAMLLSLCGLSLLRRRR